MDISVCYMVKNEEDNLRKSVMSIKHIADEIIVVDTGSVDRTKAVAGELGAMVYDFPWCDDFSAPRNYAIDKAHGEWIFFLDADEYLRDNISKQQILAILATMNGKDVIMFLLRHIMDMNNRAYFHTETAPRIFRRDSKIRYQGCIHEAIMHSERPLQVAFAPEEYYIWHTGYLRNISPQKAKRNLRLLKKAMEHDEYHPIYDKYLADCYIDLKEYEKALVHIKRFIQNGCTIHGGESSAYHVLLECLRKLNLPYQDFLFWARQACEKFPKLPEYYAEQGMCLSAMGELAEARQKLMCSLEMYKNNSAYGQHGSYFSQEVAAKVAARLGEIAAVQQNIDEAAKWFTQAMDYSPHNKEIKAKVESFIHKAEEELGR